MWRLVPVVFMACALFGAAPQYTAPFDASMRARLLDAIDRQLGHYTFEEKVPSIREAMNARRSDFMEIDDPKAFSSAVSDVLYAASHDKHLRVVYSELPIPREMDPTAADVARRRRQIAQEYAGYRVVAHLQGNIGYVRLDGFAPMPDAKSAIDNTMRSLALTDAIIIDLRQNRGGLPDSLDYLLGYFFERPVQLTSLYFHASGTKDQTMMQFSASRVDGPRYLGKPIYVLTSSRTGSAAEQFSYDLKTLHRATLIGETTAGAANPGEIFPLEEHFGLFVPQGRAVNPYTKGNWEGTGVSPDRTTTADDALVAAYTDALAIAKSSFPETLLQRRSAAAHPAQSLRESLPAE